MRIIGNDPSVPRQAQEVASGTLPNGKPVVVNADGTVAVVEIGAAAIGSAVIFENDTTADNATAYDTSNDKIVIAYRDSANSQYHTAVVGTVSGTSISFGTPVVVTSNYHAKHSINFDTNAGKMVIVTSDSGTGSYGRAIVGTVSGTSISFGSVATFYGNGVSSVGSTYDSTNNKIIIAYVDGAASNVGKAIVGTVSGTSISFGSAATFNDAVTTVYQRSIAHDSSTGKTVIAFRDTGSSNQGKAVVATVSGTSISFGSETMFESGATQDINAVYDSGNSKVNIFYEDGADSDKLKGVIGTVSGTSISFTAVQELYTAATVSGLSATYDSNASTSVASFRGASAYGYALPITSDGSSLTVGSSTTITTNAYGTKTSSAFDPDQKKVVIAYQDGDDSDKGKAQVYNTPATTLTSENYIGMSSGTAFQTGSAAAVGSKTEFESGDVKSEILGTVYDPDNQKIIISYVDDDNSDYGTAVVGTLSGTTVSYGTPAVFESGTTSYTAIGYDTANDKVVIAYKDESNSNYGTAVVGTVSGTSISFGTPVAFNSRNTQWIQVTFDTNAGKIVISYSDKGGTSDGKANVGTVSGTSISFGSQATFASTNATYIAAVYDTNAQKHVMCYRDNSNSDHGKAIVGTVSGTDITFGSAATFNSSSTEDIGIGFDSSNNKVVVANTHGSDSNKIKAYVGTVSGTSISFGSATEIVSQSYGANVLYSTTASKILIGYATSSNIPSYKTCTVSGTSITSVSDSVTLGEALNMRRFGFDPSSGSFLVAGRLNSGGGSASYAFTLDTRVTTRGQVADGGHALVDTQGAISDNQIGLTAGQSYFVQTDGTLGTTAADPSVFAGTAVSATKLIVKG